MKLHISSTGHIFLNDREILLSELETAIREQSKKEKAIDYSRDAIADGFEHAAYVAEDVIDCLTKLGLPISLPAGSFGWGTRGRPLHSNHGAVGDTPFDNNREAANPVASFLEMMKKIDIPVTYPCYIPFRSAKAPFTIKAVGRHSVALFTHDDSWHRFIEAIGPNVRIPLRESIATPRELVQRLRNLNGLVFSSFTHDVVTHVAIDPQLQAKKFIVYPLEKFAQHVEVS